MNFKFDDKDYDSEKLSDNGKLYLGKLQQIQAKQQQLNLEMADVNILQGHYSNPVSYTHLTLATRLSV